MNLQTVQLDSLHLNPTKSRKPSPVTTLSIKLKKGKGSKTTVGNLGGEFWWIYNNENKAGKIFISMKKYKDGLLPFMSIQLNAAHRATGIDATAYKLACKQSQHKEIFCTMRKNDVASRASAFKAGFVIDENYTGRQLQLVFRKLL